MAKRLQYQQWAGDIQPDAVDTSFEWYMQHPQVTPNPQLNYGQIINEPSEDDFTQWQIQHPQITPKSQLNYGQIINDPQEVDFTQWQVQYPQVTPGSEINYGKIAEELAPVDSGDTSFAWYMQHPQITPNPPSVAHHGWLFTAHDDIPDVITTGDIIHVVFGSTGGFF